MSKLMLALPNIPGKDKIIGTASKVGFKLAKHSPEICIGAGIVAGVAGTVLACRATLKVEPIIDHHKSQMEKIRDTRQKCANKEDGYDGTEYSEEDASRDKFIQTVQTIVAIGKLYAPAIICGVASVMFVIGAHRITMKRLATVTAFATSIQQAFDDYRGRVRDVVGEEKEKDIFHGVKELSAKELEELGEKADDKRKALMQQDAYSPYRFIFDESSRFWSANPETNQFFLAREQAHLNDILRIRGYVFLNEVLEAIGLTPTPNGQLAGWIYGEGDSFISFGMWDATKEGARRFINKIEPSIWLDFNCDGVIYDKI